MKQHLVITSIVIAMLSIAYYNNDNESNFVLLLGICHPIARNVSFVFKGYPWSAHHVTIMDRIDATYNVMKILAGISYKKTLMHSARANSDNLSFEKTGFMLVQNEQIIDPSLLNEDEYQQRIINILWHLFPAAQRIQFVNTMYHGNEDNPPNPWVHIDNKPSRETYASINAFRAYSDMILDSNHSVWVIGTWMPFQMKGNVCKDSLALLDGSTLQKQDIKIFSEDWTHKQSNGTVLRVNDEMATVIYNKNHKWYYYPNMSNHEMIIFTHFRSDAITMNAHSSFTPNHCDSNHEPRKSVVSRILIQF